MSRPQSMTFLTWRDFFDLATCQQWQHAWRHANIGTQIYNDMDASTPRLKSNWNTNIYIWHGRVHAKLKKVIGTQIYNGMDASMPS